MSPYPIPRDVVTPCAADPDRFFPDKNTSPGRIEAIKDICRTGNGGQPCAYLDGCREWAIKHGESGIWAATTDGERSRYRRANGIVPERLLPLLPRQYNRPRSELVACPSFGAISRHRADNEDVCDECKTFANEHRRQRKARKKAS